MYVFSCVSLHLMVNRPAHRQKFGPPKAKAMKEDIYSTSRYPTPFPISSSKHDHSSSFTSLKISSTPVHASPVAAFSRSFQYLSLKAQYSSPVIGHFDFSNH